MIHYQHRQFGKAIVVALGCTVLVCLAVTNIQRPGPRMEWVVAGICAVCAYLFSSLEIVINDDHLRWAFGPGLISGKVALTEIAEATVTRTKFWEGWGIHWTRRGVLYNVSGFDAVLIKLKSGKQFMLGTDDPTRLVEALASRR
jgi:hypothetical protein